jgi:predicted LPLAT superfamily acyltransferase
MKSWTHRRERGSTWLLRLIAWLARATGRPVCRALLYPIVLYFLLTDAVARRASAEFLQAATGRPASLRDVFAHFHCFAVTILDRVYMAAGEFDRFEITLVGLPLLEEALKAGRGCLLLGSHLGSFDFLMLAQRAMVGRPVSVLMRVDPRARIRRIAGIDDSQLNVIATGRPDSLLRAYEALVRGGVVAVLADRVVNAACLPVRFLGRPTSMPIAPHLLAARSGAPALMCFGLYEGQNRYRVEFAQFGPIAPPAARGKALQPSIDRYAAILGTYAQRYPLNWFNFYPFWTSVEDSA